MDSIADMVDNLPVPVFHGTRVSMAERIMRDGFAPLPVTAQIETVAAAHDVAVDAVRQDLEAYNRFAAVDSRPNTLFVTANKVKAGSWAYRAPEATWEALWAVYRLSHPDLGWDFESSQERHLWVRAQMLSDPPAVVELTVPLGRLRRRAGDRTAADDFREALESGSPESLERFKWLFNITPEWLVDPRDATPTGYRVVPTRVHHRLMQYMSEASEETFLEQLQADYWGEPGASADKGDWTWFPFDQVWSRLSDQRQAELEEIVGVPITERLAGRPAPAGAGGG